MHIERHTISCRDVTPNPEGVSDKARRGVAGFRWVAGQAAMAFAVDLEVVGSDLLDDVLDHLGSGVLADFGAIGPGVEIVMDSKETVGAFEALGAGFSGIAGESCRGQAKAGDNTQ
jgi:hypothetical protein